MLWDKNTGEPVHNAIVWQDTRTDALCKELGRNVGQDRFRRETGLPLASYFAGPKVRWLLDNVEGLRERAEARRHPLRHHGLLGHLEPDRRRQRRRARHRRHQRLAHHADEPAHHGVGREDPAESIGVPAADAAGDPLLRRGLRQSPAASSAPARRRPGRLRARRPAGGPVRPDLFRRGRGQVHVRHRHLHADEHRRQARQLVQRPADHGRLPDRRPAAGLRPGGLHRRHRLAGAVDARPDGPDQHRRRDRDAGAARSRTTAAPTSCRPSPACSPRTGAPTPAV